MVADEARIALELNHDLERISLWAWQWYMQFNAEETEKVIFSAKLSTFQQPSLNFGSKEIARKIEHKHLGMILVEN